MARVYNFSAGPSTLPEKVLEQAEAYGHSVLREFAFLIVHSVLHLTGYDHMEDEERACMEARQREIMEQADILR